MVDEIEGSVEGANAQQSDAKANRLKVKNVELRVKHIKSITPYARKQRARNRLVMKVLESLADSTKGYAARLAASTLAAYDDVDANTGGAKAGAASAVGVKEVQEER